MSVASSAALTALAALAAGAELDGVGETSRARDRSSAEDVWRRGVDRRKTGRRTGMRQVRQLSRRLARGERQSRDKHSPDQGAG